MTEKILIVEDEKSIASLIAGYLKKEGYEVIMAHEGFEGIRMYHEHQPHLLILDRMLPDISGDQVCEEVRKLSSLPILMLTARADERARIEGFELGVDDYVTKPFSAKEVMLRVKVLLKRSYGDSKKHAYEDDYLLLDKVSKSVLVNQADVQLTANEYDLFETLYDNRPQPLSRSQLVTAVFGYAYDGYDRNIDTYIKNIRHKVEENPKEPIYIKTKYGVGYYFGK